MGSKSSRNRTDAKIRHQAAVITRLTDLLEQAKALIVEKMKEVEYQKRRVERMKDVICNNNTGVDSADGNGVDVRTEDTGVEETSEGMGRPLDAVVGSLPGSGGETRTPDGSISDSPEDAAPVGGGEGPEPPGYVGADSNLRVRNLPLPGGVVD